MQIVIPIQIDRTDSAILTSKALQLYRAVVKAAVETLGEEWIVVAPGEERVVRCFPKAEVIGGHNGTGGHGQQIILPPSA